MAVTQTYTNRINSAPKVLIDDEVIAVIPNSVDTSVPGDAKVRFVSTGGGSGDIVMGLNAETLIAKVKMKIPFTQQNADRVRKWKANMINGVFSTIQIVEKDGQYPYQKMQLTKDTMLPFKADGDIDLEWEGQYVG